MCSRFFNFKIDRPIVTGALCVLIWTASDPAFSSPVEGSLRAIQKGNKSSSLPASGSHRLRHGASTAAGRRSAPASTTRRLPLPSRSTSASPGPPGCRLLELGRLRAPHLSGPRASLAAGESEGARWDQRQRAEGVPVRGARRVAIGGAQRNQARVPAPRAQVPPGRQQGGSVPVATAAARSRSYPLAFRLISTRFLGTLVVTLLIASFRGLC